MDPEQVGHRHPNCGAFDDNGSPAHELLTARYGAGSLCGGVLVPEAVSHPDCQDHAQHPERIGDRVADHGVGHRRIHPGEGLRLVLEDRGESGSVGEGSAEQSRDHRLGESGHPTDGDCHHSRRNQAPGDSQVGAQAAPPQRSHEAGSRGDPQAVHEEHQAEQVQGLWEAEVLVEGSDPQPDEEHTRDSKAEAPEPGSSQQVAEAEDQEEDEKWVAKEEVGHRTS
jgi:hypothetical protein